MPILFSEKNKKGQLLSVRSNSVLKECLDWTTHKNMAWITEPAYKEEEFKKILLKSLDPFFDKIKKIKKEELLKEELVIEYWTVQGKGVNAKAVKRSSTFWVDPGYKKQVEESILSFQQKTPWMDWKALDEDHFVKVVGEMMEQKKPYEAYDILNKEIDQLSNVSLKKVLNKISNERNYSNRDRWGNFLLLCRLNSWNPYQGDDVYWYPHDQYKYWSLEGRSLNKYRLDALQDSYAYGLMPFFLKQMYLNSINKKKITVEEWVKVLDHWLVHPKEAEQLIHTQVSSFLNNFFNEEEVIQAVDFSVKPVRMYLHSEKGWASLVRRVRIFELEWVKDFNQAHLFSNEKELENAKEILPKAFNYSILTTEHQWTRVKDCKGYPLSEEGDKLKAWIEQSQLKGAIQEEKEAHQRGVPRSKCRL